MRITANGHGGRGQKPRTDSDYSFEEKVAGEGKYFRGKIFENP
jgi:hypothetical protein